MNILLVEDDREIAQMLQDFLQSENFAVQTAADGAQALHIFQQTAFDLVLLDLMIPNINGIKVLQAIRQQSTVPVIILSAKDTDSDITLGLGLGADDYITQTIFGYTGAGSHQSQSAQSTAIQYRGAVCRPVRHAASRRLNTGFESIYRFQRRAGD